MQVDNTGNVFYAATLVAEERLSNCLHQKVFGSCLLTILCCLLLTLASSVNATCSCDALLILIVPVWSKLCYETIFFTSLDFTVCSQFEFSSLLIIIRDKGEYNHVAGGYKKYNWKKK